MPQPGSRRGTAAPRRGRVIVVSSPSGGGKTTVVERLRRRVRGLRRSVSVTTRDPRPGERRGREYQFVSAARFQAMRRAGQLLEWAQVHGACYGTPKRPVLDALRRGQVIMLNIDVQGARKIRRVLGRRAVLVFLKPPSMADLRQRLFRRSTDTAAAIRRRLAAAKRELACAASYDVIVVNDRLEDAVSRLEAIVRRVARDTGGSSEG